MTVRREPIISQVCLCLEMWQLSTYHHNGILILTSNCIGTLGLICASWPGKKTPQSIGVQLYRAQYQVIWLKWSSSALAWERILILTEYSLMLISFLFCFLGHI